MNKHTSQSRLNHNLLILISLIIIISLSCNALVSTPAQKTEINPAVGTIQTPPPIQATEEMTQTPQVVTQPAVVIPKNIYPAAFAKYPANPVSLPPKGVPGYPLPVDLGSVQGADQVKLSKKQEDLLSQNGFVVAAPVPGKYNEFYQLYESLRYDEQPVFATTDAVLHVYHLIFDKMLRDLEREYFISTLEVLTQSMLKASLDQLENLRGTPLEEPARRNAAFFAVGAKLLDLQASLRPDVNDLAEAELALIESHSEYAVSPIWDRPDLPEDKKLIEDYTQYIPRGHYTRSEALKRYFKAMMWYGRLTFRLRDNFETRRALLLVQALRSATTPDGRSAIELWESIYEPTVFIVGKSDDLSYHEYGALSDAVFGAKPDLTAFADDALLAQFKDAASKLPPPQVNSMWVWIWEDKQEATKGFRFMGQRFTLDAYVFGQLIWRKVGTSDKPRWLPKGLDFIAAQGSEEALFLLDKMGETSYENYPKQMEKIRQEIAALGLDSWTQNLYWTWLYTLQPIFEKKGDPYPGFMQTKAWEDKDLSTALGSWTELKHDTILYAKQVMAEMGGGEPEHPPHGYVEPNPEAFARLLALSQMTYDGLNQRNLLSQTTRGNLENLSDELKFLKDIAEKELAGQPLSDDDYWRIQYFGGWLEAMTIAASDCETEVEGCRNLQDQKAALIADVATGNDQALEEAIGQPTEIYVVLPDEPWRIGIGGVFTYYEFPVPTSQRMTDEQWQQQVEQGTNPPPPDWTTNFMAP